MGDEKNVVLTIIAGSALIFLLILVIIIFVVYYSKKILQKESDFALSLKNKELELLRAVIQTQESEREKIASNLHDEVGPLLSTLKLNISKHKRSLEKKLLTSADLDIEREFIDNIIDNIRTASHHLTPQFVLKYGLIKGLENFISPIVSPKIELTTNLEHEYNISKQITINVYRITLELVNNAIKHGDPKKMGITLLQHENVLEISLIHDGKGLNEDIYNSKSDEKHGLGLHSIKSRILILNGTIKFYQKEKESITQLQIPIHK